MGLKAPSHMALNDLEMAIQGHSDLEASSKGAYR